MMWVCLRGRRGWWIGRGGGAPPCLDVDANGCRQQAFAGAASGEPAAAHWPLYRFHTPTCAHRRLFPGAMRGWRRRSVPIGGTGGALRGARHMPRSPHVLTPPLDPSRSPGATLPHVPVLPPLAQRWWRGRRPSREQPPTEREWPAAGARPLSRPPTAAARCREGKWRVSAIGVAPQMAWRPPLGGRREREGSSKSRPGCRAHILLSPSLLVLHSPQLGGQPTLITHTTFPHTLTQRTKKNRVG